METVMVQLIKGTSSNDTLIGTTADDWMLGGGGDDYMNGSSGNDHLSGYLGHDTLLGGLGADRLDGGAGKDFLNGGYNNDSLAGGAEADTFAFDLVSRGYGNYERPMSPGYDVVADFTVGEDELQFNMIGDIGALNFTQSGADTVITFDDVAGSITLTGVNLDSLLAHQTTDFWFI
jgi:Ca2+-binding RTX toxin-like protein